MNTKRFHISDMLSVMTPYIVSNNHIGGVYEIMNWLTGENLFTHQLPRAWEPCQQFLRLTFPAIGDNLNLPPNAGEDGWDWKSWLTAMEHTHGEWFDVPAMPQGEFYKAMHPMKEPILQGKHVIVMEARDGE